MPIMQLNLIKGPIICFPRHDLKFSTSSCFKKPIFGQLSGDESRCQREMLNCYLTDPSRVILVAGKLAGPLSSWAKKQKTFGTGEQDLDLISPRVTSVQWNSLFPPFPHHKTIVDVILGKVRCNSVCSLIFFKLLTHALIFLLWKLFSLSVKWWWGIWGLGSNIMYCTNVIVKNVNVNLHFILCLAIDTILPRSTRV